MKKVYYFLFIVLISSLYFLYSCDSNPSGAPDYLPGGVYGLVLDSATHQPLAGVNVTSIPSSPGCMTDTAGNYILGGIPMSSSGTRVLIIYSKSNYLNDTTSIWVRSDDTVPAPNVRLLPDNGVYVRDNLNVMQYQDANSYSNIDLYYLYTTHTLTIARDIDLRDSSNLNSRYQFRSSDLDLNLKGFRTRFGKSQGDFSKYDFDTLAMYYGAHDSLWVSDFMYDRTSYFYTPLTERMVIPFYLEGRYNPNNNLPVYGLLYIKYSYIDIGTNLFGVIVDVKINKNGKNYFLPYSK